MSNEPVQEGYREMASLRLRCLSQRHVADSKQLLLRNLPISILLNSPNVLVVPHLVIIDGDEHAIAC